jgi:hypothetical protein
MRGLPKLIRKIWLVELHKPARALELLRGLAGATLPPQHEALRRKIQAIAQQKVSEGVLEVDDVAW